MPLNPKVKFLLDKHGGKSPEISLCSYNVNIKKVCQIAGINQLVEITKTKGVSPITIRAPKYQFISSHTARRTGATLLYMSGVPIKQCMFITGHQTEENFMKYIRISKEESALILADNPFFK